MSIIARVAIRVEDEFFEPLKMVRSIKQETMELLRLFGSERIRSEYEKIRKIQLINELTVLLRVSTREDRTKFLVESEDNL